MLIAMVTKVDSLPPHFQSPLPACFACLKEKPLVLETRNKVSLSPVSVKNSSVSHVRYGMYMYTSLKLEEMKRIKVKRKVGKILLSYLKLILFIPALCKNDPIGGFL